ncbi:MAG: nuclear transport factor 2 family protein [Methanobacterium sp.]|nr:nuclear transport factor 2 family protein [Methanobacterium sp.]
MEKEEMKRIIHEYINSYNEFNVARMIKDVHENVEFRNIANGEINLELTGKNALLKQAKESVTMFKEREMKIIEQKIEGNILESKIDFRGVLAIDFPEGPKAGETIEIRGKSIFKFKEDKIILIEDIS